MTMSVVGASHYDPSSLGNRISAMSSQVCLLVQICAAMFRQRTALVKDLDCSNVYRGYVSVEFIDASMLV